MFDNMLSNSLFTFFWFSEIFSKSKEISFDLLNIASSLDFEISFFSFSNVSFF